MSISVHRWLLVAAALWGAAAVAQPLAVTGRVLAGDGAGLAGASVALEPLLPSHLRAESQLAGVWEEEPVARTRTGGDGGFRLTAPAPGFWRVVVRHPDRLPAAYDLSPLLAPVQLADLEMQRRSELAVRWGAEDGAAAAGDDAVAAGGGAVAAGVTLVVRGWSAIWQASAKDGWWPADRRVRLGPDGGALPCAGGEKLSVAARVGGRVVYREAACDAGLLELGLDHGLRTVRLVHPEGVPAAGVQGFIPWPFLAFGASDAEGRVRGPFDWQDAVPVAFADASAFYGQARWAVPGGEEAGAGRAALTLELPPTVAVRGQVVDSVRGGPVAGAWLWVGRGSHHFLAAGRGGGFALRLRAGKGSTLFCGAPGYLTIAHSPPAAASDLAVRLTPAMSLSGRVVDATGQPVAGAAIDGEGARHLFDPRYRDLQGEGRWRLDAARGVSDAAGAFELGGLVPWARLDLRVARAGFVTRHLTVSVPAPGAAVDELAITLERGRGAFGRVLNESEMPIAGAEVELLPSLTGAAAEQDFSARGRFAATTDGEGLFHLVDLPAGTFYLAARGRGFPELLVPGIEIADAGDESGPSDLGTVILVPGILLSGRVVDARGEPVAGARLSLRDADGEQIVVQRAASVWFATAESRDNGSFHLDSLPRGRRLVLLVTADGFLPCELAIPTANEDQQRTVELERGAAVAGEVIDPRGRPASRARVRLSPGEAASRLPTSTARDVETGEEGRFEVSGLRPGDYVVTASGGGAESDPVHLKLDAGGRTDVEVRLRRRASLIVLVADAEGGPVAGAAVSATLADASAAGWQRPLRASTDALGEAVLQPLAAGLWQVRASHRDFEPGAVSVELEDGSARRLELRLERGREVELYRVAGRVVDAAGLPLGGARVSLSGSPGAAPVTSAADGGFELAAAAGEYSLYCEREGFAAFHGEAFTLTAAGVEDLVVEMSPGATVVGRVSGLEPEELSRLVILARGPYVEVDGFELFGQQYGTVSFAGEIRIPGLSPGKWVVRGELLNPTRAASEPIEVDRGTGEVRVDLHFAPGARLTGIVWRQGRPLTGSTVTLRCAGEFRAATFTGSEGRFAVDHVPPGRCAVESTDPDSGLQARQELEVVSDVDVVLEIGSSSDGSAGD